MLARTLARGCKSRVRYVRLSSTVALQQAESGGAKNSKPIATFHCHDVKPYTVGVRGKDSQKIWGSELNPESITFRFSSDAEKELYEYITARCTSCTLDNLIIDPALTDEVVPDNVLPTARREVEHLRFLIEQNYGAAIVDPIRMDNLDQRTQDGFIRFSSLLLGKLLGTLLPQNNQGHKSVAVYNRDSALRMETGARYHQTRQGGSIHTDNVASLEPWDSLLLSCISPAFTGGESILVSTAKIHEYFLQHSPETLEILAKPFWWECRGFSDEFFLAPVLFYNKHEEPCMRYLRDYMESAAVRQHSPFTPQQLWALNMLDAALEMSEHQCRFFLKPGQHIIMSGNQTLHGRTSFCDSMSNNAGLATTTTTNNNNNNNNDDDDDDNTNNNNNNETTTQQNHRPRFMQRAWIANRGNNTRAYSPLSPPSSASSSSSSSSSSGTTQRMYHSSTPSLSSSSSQSQSQSQSHSQSQSQSPSQSPSPHDFHTIILAAGASRRMGDFANNRPKSLLKLHNEESILNRQLSLLQERGFRQVTMMLGAGANHMLEAIDSRTGPAKNLDVDSVITHDYETTGHSWTWYLAKESWEREGRKPVLLLHADIVYDPRILDELISTPYQSVLGITEGVVKKTGDEWCVLGKGKGKGKGKGGGEDDVATSVATLKLIQGEGEMIQADRNKWSSIEAASMDPGFAYMHTSTSCNKDTEKGTMGMSDVQHLDTRPIDPVRGEIMGMNKLSASMASDLFGFMPCYFNTHTKNINWEALMDRFMARRYHINNRTEQRNTHTHTHKHEHEHEHEHVCAEPIHYLASSLDWINVNYPECYQRAMNTFKP